MLQDTTNTLPIQIGLTVDLNVINRKSVFADPVMNEQNCLVCGILKARPFFLACSSYCDSIAISKGFYNIVGDSSIDYELNEDSTESDWLRWEINRVLGEMKELNISLSRIQHTKRKFREVLIEEIKYRNTELKGLKKQLEITLVNDEGLIVL